MRMTFRLVAAFVTLAFVGQAQAQTVVYDGLNAGTVATSTGSTPRTYMGQGFSIADPGGVAAITQIRVTMIAAVAVNYVNTRLRVGLWNTYDPSQTGTNLVFSNPIATFSFATGALTTAGATAITWTLPFSNIPLNGLLSHGITFNYQSDPTGSGTFADDTNLTTALRTGTGGTIPPPALTAGADLNPGGGYFRNASGLTTFNFQAGDARTIANVGGLMFEITAVAIPEPTTVLLMGVAGAGIAGGLFLKRRQAKKAMDAKLKA